MILLNRRIQILSVMALLIPAAYQGSEPQALSIAPLGGQRGARLEATLRGQSLQGAYAVWFDREGVTATVERVEEVAAGGDEQPVGRSPAKVQKLTLGLRIDRSAGTGRYQLRVVSPQGVSGPLAFLVHDLPSVAESNPSSGQAPSPQPVDFPCAINGVISRPGERDLFAVRAAKGQQLRFELISNPSGISMGGRAGYRGGFDSVLTLYRPRGSWFEEGRLHRLAYDDKSKANPRTNPRIETRFRQPGLYLLEVGSFYNLGGAKFSYQLRVTPNGPAATGTSPGHRQRLRIRSLAGKKLLSHHPAGSHPADPGQDGGARQWAGSGRRGQRRASPGGRERFRQDRLLDRPRTGIQRRRRSSSGSDSSFPGGRRHRPTRRRGQAGFLPGPTRPEAQL